MARYALNLPAELKREAERLAKSQGVSLNQFVLWSVAEKVGALRQGLDDPNFPNITYRRGASGQLTPIVASAGIRVQTLVIAARDWELPVESIASEYGLPEHQVMEALGFYEAHQGEIDGYMVAEESLDESQA